jgi:hypothetical protein
MLKMIRTFWLSVSIVMTSGFAFAAEPAKPEIMLVINTSGSMQRTPDQNGALSSFAQCAPGAAGASNGTHSLSVMNRIQNVLAGSPRLPINELTQRCIYDVLETSEAEHVKAVELFKTELPFIRRSIMPTGIDVITSTNRKGYVVSERACCLQSSNDQCSSWRICDDEGGSASFNTDGLLHQYSETYKFGLMTTDFDPNTADSFGEDETQPSLSVAPQFLNNTVVAQFYAELRGVPVTNQPNYGAQPMLGNEASLATGSLISPHRGKLNNGRVSERAMIGESQRQLRAHTDYVIRRVRGLKPRGFSAFSAQLRDYRRYLDKRAEPGLFNDPRGDCRKRVVIILGEADTASKAYHSAECLGGVGNACPPSENYPYNTVKTELTMLAQAGDLSVFYLAFGLSEAQRLIYDQVLTGVGAAISLTSEADLKRELSQILGSVESQKTTYRAPLIISPNVGDDVHEDIKQFRITGYSTASAGGRYGRVDVSAFGCPSGGGQDPLGRLRSLTTYSYEVASKIALQTKMSSFASHPDRNESFGLNGTAEPSLVSPGQFGAQPNIGEEDLRTLTHLSQDESFDSVYQMLEGYFGAAMGQSSDDACRPLCGLPAGQKQRQLGAIEYGQFVAVVPPRLNLSGDAYQAFQLNQRERPTLVATGASDGKVHFFRVEDGYEVFSFVPNAALFDLAKGVEEAGAGGLAADGDLVARNMIVCRSLGEGTATCPGDPESFDIRSFVAGGIGRSEGNLFGIDLTKVAAVLKSDRDNTITVDDVKTWDIVSGYPDPREPEELEWRPGNDVDLFVEER